MTTEHILDAIGLLDDDLIQEAERYLAPKRRLGARSWAALAASFAVVILLGYGAVRPGMAGGGKGLPKDEMDGAFASTQADDMAGGEALPEQPMGSGAGELNGAGTSAPLPEPGASGGTELTEWEERPAIMVDGALYWSTGIPCSGEVAEEAAQTVTSYTSALPEMDGQTNFSQDLSARYAWTPQGLAVQWEEEWILFSPDPSSEG
ncbi:hypothetical protein D7V91_05110 [bacterium 1xD42-67]|nr:hypothetical protein D7V91_05110 [bacterium 1xD42-67]